MPKIVAFGILALGVLSALTAQADIGYQFVTVGNPGNVNDTVTANDGSGSYGGVSYAYDIGKYDVTLNQYTTFLNAVANADPYGLYHPTLGTDLNFAGISQSGNSGSYTYSVIGDGNRPVTLISWLDAARFANWMQNGQPSGLGEMAASTEQGAYALNGDTTSGLETKNANATYWIPTENEWYKAAYYDPTLNSGAGGYWTFATRSNTIPGNNAQNPTPANQVNYHNDNGIYSVTQTSGYSSTQNYLTAVGLFSNSASYYGTYDQNGDLYQWNDAVISDLDRGIRGGSFDYPSVTLQSFYRTDLAPTVQNGDYDVGFRLASAVPTPEPSVAVSLIIAGGLLLARRKRPSAF